MGHPHVGTPVLRNAGYGQLSITAVLTAGPHQNAAGAWAILGSQTDVDAAKAGGPATTAAVVANSTIAADAVHADSTNGRGVYGHSVTQPGIVGESDVNEGVSGITHNRLIPAVSGRNPGGRAGFFDGQIEVTGNAEVNGTVAAQKLVAREDIVLTGADCAEEFDLAPEERGEPGAVMVIDDSQRLSACAEAYDPRVTGVISGAEEYWPGLILDRRESSNPRRPIALIGKVYCKADATYGAIRVGDPLTTSPTPGHAMKAADRSRAFGATIGKALRSLPDGTGMIPVLVSMR